MLLVVLLILLVLLVAGLLFLPIECYIDTRTQQYYMKFGALVKANIEPHETEIIAIRIRAIFLNYNIYPLKVKSKSKKKLETTKVKKPGVRKRQIKKLRKVWSVVQSFEVKRFLLDIDTGDCISNAKLYPVFALMNYRWGGFGINFEGRNRLTLHITNRPFYIIRSFINI